MEEERFELKLDQFCRWRWVHLHQRITSSCPWDGGPPRLILGKAQGTAVASAPKELRGNRTFFPACAKDKLHEARGEIFLRGNQANVTAHSE